MTGKERAPTLPDVPTMAEAGFPEVVGRDLDRGGGAGGYAERHHRQAQRHDRRGLGAPDIKAKLASMAYVGIGNSPEECTQFFKEEMATWSKVIKDAGLHAE